MSRKTEKNGRKTKKGKTRRNRNFYGKNTPRGARFVISQFNKTKKNNKKEKKTKTKNKKFCK